MSGDSRGFTFVEVLIVVALVGIIGASTVPPLAAGADRARARAAASVLGRSNVVIACGTAAPARSVRIPSVNRMSSSE